jgi:signal transduction histidine kinase
MHDVLAHTLSGLTVQLEATRLLAEQRPGDPAVAVAVANAHRLAREGLLEARRAVSALRGDLPGPDQLDQLLHDFEVDSGIHCRLEIEGTPVPLRPEAQLALYRTAQEALTNIRKHADATSVVLRLVWSQGGAELTVEDEGTPKPSLMPGGYGLSGIRERAALVGGSLEAGPIEGGFRVRLRVPA